MKRLKTQKGITLVALVITIIVLLILAVVAIGAVRDSGVIGHSQNSAHRYNAGKLEEELDLQNYVDTINIYDVNEEEIKLEEATKYYEYVTGYHTQKYVFALEFNEKNVNVKLYEFKDNKVINTNDFGDCTYTEGTEDITLEGNITISKPYKIINFGQNTYLKGDKYYVPLENYCEFVLNPNFDTNILK